MESQPLASHPSLNPWQSRKTTRFPHSHSFDGCSLYMGPEPKTPTQNINKGVGQIKLPKWAKYSCQTQ